MTVVYMVDVSRNGKTGPIPTTMSEEKTCAASCPLKGAGCYAEYGHTRMNWQKTHERGVGWGDFVAKVRRLPKGQLWRHNVAGDLPGVGDAIDAEALAALVKANRDRRGFTYTHKPPVGDNAAAIAAAVAGGFTINLSANTLEEADSYSRLGIAPVAVVLAEDAPTRTPEGRVVAVCPAVRSDAVTCATCGICAKADRKSIIGFPVHGPGARKARSAVNG